MVWVQLQTWSSQTELPGGKERKRIQVDTSLSFFLINQLTFPLWKGKMNSTTHLNLCISSNRHSSVSKTVAPFIENSIQNRISYTIAEIYCLKMHFHVNTSTQCSMLSEHKMKILLCGMPHPAALSKPPGRRMSHPRHNLLF